ncbi:hypothetical protein AYI68_g8342 [Smittium mucronatum]|uniref:Uncharacterized protein n=1 Tax=Smittium mucronatum TaxID=133383 RepID=A0A1R0GL66_9FUNG|nr:hypothetical protein AYI68_g8342 [Smittium mucronatum]
MAKPTSSTSFTLGYSLVLTPSQRYFILSDLIPVTRNSVLCLLGRPSHPGGVQESMQLEQMSNKFETDRTWLKDQERKILHDNIPEN